MNDDPIHYYNVILGKCVCGARANAQKKSWSVFPGQVTCEECQAVLKRQSKTPEAK